MDVDTPRGGTGAGDTFLQVRLITKSSKYATPDVPYSFPASIGPRDLNVLLNQLLSESSGSLVPIEFDFLVNGDILQGSFGDHVLAHQLSTENVLEVEYVERVPAPKPENSLDHSDWVSALHVMNDLILTGSYDNKMSVWSGTGKLRLQSEAHLAPVRAVAWVDANSDGGTFLTSSHDQTAALWYLYYQGKKAVCAPRAFYRGHAGSVDGLSVSPDKQNFCSVSWDKMLKIWSLAEEVDEGLGSDGEPADKKHKTEGKRLTRVPTATLAGHKEAATTCVWTGPSEIITASWDHSIKLWDVELGGMSRQLDGPKAFLSIAYSPLNRLLVTGATDRLVRLYDPRSNEGSIVKIGFMSHMGWVPSVSWSPLNENLFISGSYDMLMKMWDIRSPKSPMYDMAGHTEKILCTSWTHSNLLLSGGADSAVKIFSASL